MVDHYNEWVTRVICDKSLVSLKFLGFMPNALIPMGGSRGGPGPGLPPDHQK